MRFSAKTKLLSTSPQVLEKNGKRFFFITILDEGNTTSESSTTDIFLDATHLGRYNELADLPPLTDIEIDMTLRGNFKQVNNINTLEQSKKSKVNLA